MDLFVSGNAGYQKHNLAMQYKTSTKRKKTFSTLS